MKQTFEDFLSSKHAEDYHGCDDDMPDAFESWLNELSVDDMILHANEYASLKNQMMLEEVLPEELEHDSYCPAFDKNEDGICSCGREYWNRCRQQIIDNFKTKYIIVLRRPSTK